MIDAKTLHELENALQDAQDYRKAFADAVKAQAEQHQLDPQALRRFVTARLADKLDKLQRQEADIAQLALQFPVVAG